MRKLLLLIGFAQAFCLSAAGQKPPKIVSRNRVVQLDSFYLSKGADTTVVFHYRNEGDSALVIRRMNPGCTCVVPTYSTQPLMPGDSTTFRASFTPSHAGPFSQTITITYSTPGGSKLYITRVGIKGTVLEEESCTSCEQ